jgi:hypothetical protein
MATRTISVKVKPIARGAKPAGAPADVAPIITRRKKNVRRVSVMAQERRL